jgi:hypothetical protein
MQQPQVGGGRLGEHRLQRECQLLDTSALQSFRFLPEYASVDRRDLGSFPVESWIDTWSVPSVMA